MSDSLIRVRRTFTHVEDTLHEFGPVAAQPLRRGYVAAVLANPYAGRHEPDLMPMMGALNAVGVAMAALLLSAMDVPVTAIEGYGKGAIVGASGELEHGAMWHVPGGYAMRALLGWTDDAGAVPPEGARSDQPGNALAIVPSTKKVAGPGACLDVPLTHINASYVRSHFDAIEVRVPGAPAADEIVFVLAMSCGARVHARLGGLAVADIRTWDGLR